MAILGQAEPPSFHPPRILVARYPAPMKTLSLSEVKMKLSALVDEGRDRDEEIVITRNGAPVAVLVSSNVFESWRETTAMQLDPASLAEIRQGLAALDEGGAALYTLEELFDG